ncbi:hypothetical protein, partial [Candidatus Accumulibacter vicinus]|uniref:hypothetical protein n=1 Tax=Candidatus Accumulibacter vicinus TaxID=2954382 RepID=UPI00235B7052
MDSHERREKPNLNTCRKALVNNSPAPSVRGSNDDRGGRAGPAASQRHGQNFQQRRISPPLPKRLPQAVLLLNPQDAAAWRFAVAAAGMALRGHGNPLPDTPWERHHGLSLVVNFYYPRNYSAGSWHGLCS